MYELKKSPLKSINSIWHAILEEAGVYDDYANPNWSIGFTRHSDLSYAVELIGPTSKPRKVDGFLGDEYWGAELRFDTTVSNLNKYLIKDKFINLPVIKNQFYLAGQLFKIPNYSELENFILELENKKIVLFNSQINKVIEGDTSGYSLRNWQRLFRQVTGLTRKQIEQIERINKAYILLKQGVSSADVVIQTGYSDQSHLIRELKTFYKITPSKIK